MLGILSGIQRQGWFVLREPAFVRVAGFFFLQIPRIGEQKPTKLEGCLAAIDRAFESVLDQKRKITAVIEVSVGQNDGLDFSGLERQRLPVPQSQLLEALEQPAINQETLLIVIKEIFGASYRSGCPQEGNFQDVLRFGGLPGLSASARHCAVARVGHQISETRTAQNV